jgi:hypothetical protein
VNWKASMLGALLVAICGLAVGVAVGGKTTTKVLRVTTTVHAAATTPAAQIPSSTTTASTSSTVPVNTTSTSAESPTESTGQQEFLAEYLAAQNGEKLSSDASDVSLASEPSKQELQGKTYDQAVVFNINVEEGDSASFQVPTPGFSRLTSKAVGLETISNAEAAYKLTVYKNDDSSPDSVVLYQASFHGPSEVHKMDFALQGATDLLFVWTKSSASPSDAQDVFILANPVLTQ